MNVKRMLSKNFLVNSAPYRVLRYLYESFNWIRRGYRPPSPLATKHAAMRRNAVPNATWVETGTYRGETTRVLSKNGMFVHSVEPDSTLCLNARSYFKPYSNVEIIHGLSEEILPKLLPKLSGNVNFWLDGHASGGETYCGPIETPICRELECISENLYRFGSVAVMIDDVRCFKSESGGDGSYPSLGFLVGWADENQLTWSIEQDIFFARSECSTIGFTKG